MSVIEINNLTRDYGGGKGIFDVSFQVNKGEVFGFLGPNGAGKTTTIRHLMGFIKNRSGECTIDGLDCWRDRAIIQKTLGYIPGEINFFDDMSGTEFLNFIAKYRGLTDLSRQKELLEKFELDPKGKIKKMSKGMKQKIGIITAFMHNPDILILDEPTNSLDKHGIKEIHSLLLSLKKRNKLILIASHNNEDIHALCDEIYEMENGQIEFHSQKGTNHNI